VLVAVGATLLVITLGCKPARSEAAPAQARHINSERLQGTLEKLSEFGHAPQEFSSWDDIANGTEVLYRTILRLDPSKAARP
jgi:hypothetical protein